MEVIGMGAVVRLRIGQFHKIADAKGWTKPNRTLNTSAAAQAIGCEVGTLSRIIHGSRSCGGTFIAGLLRAAAPFEFADLFVVDDRDERGGDPSESVA